MRDGDIRDNSPLLLNVKSRHSHFVFFFFFFFRHSHFGKQYEGFKTELPHDPADSTNGIYPQKTKTLN